MAAAATRYADAAVVGSACVKIVERNGRGPRGPRSFPGSSDPSKGTEVTWPWRFDSSGKKDESDKKIKIPEGMWIKCDACLEIIYKPEVERNLNVCPKCVYHFRIPARERIRAVIDEGTFVEFGEEMESVDVLNFTDTRSTSIA